MPKAIINNSTNEKRTYWIVLADTQLGAVHWQNLIREEDYYKAFQTQCSLAAEDESCLGIIGLGDLRERASIQAKNLGGMNRGLKILADANKPLLAIMGNHDYTTPNWIDEMCYPSLKNLTKKHVQLEYGFDPQTTLALHFTPKGDLIEKLKENNLEEIKILFLHQSLRELTTNLKQSYDISLADLEDLGLGKKQDCTVFLGDLHNYGDVSRKTESGHTITAVYPGSLEMTDANEGINGLKTERISTSPHDYRKFVLKLYRDNDNENSTTWEPIEINPRPWFRGKAKTKKETDRIESLLLEHSKSWKKALSACVYLTVPKSETERIKTSLSDLNILQSKVEEYNLETDEDANEDQTQLDGALSWQENKNGLLALAKEEKLDEDALSLLRHIVESDGATHNPKNDILNAWSKWFTNQNNNNFNENLNPNNNPKTQNNNEPKETTT
jgi:DNA repair exonuclease SbcCD nuclease subunit